jgi:polyhydroxyalkanoate synthesis regulator phasin
MANHVDESRALLSETMKRLFPPRVELDRRQNRMLEDLAQKSGKSLKDLVRQAVERYLEDQRPPS